MAMFVVMMTVLAHSMAPVRVRIAVRVRARITIRIRARVRGSPHEHHPGAHPSIVCW